MTERVYFTKYDGAIKIGYSVDVPGRMGDLDSGIPGYLYLIGSVPGGRRVELACHKMLATHRLKKEWFADHPDVYALLKNLHERGVDALGSFYKPRYLNHRTDADDPHSIFQQELRRLIFKIWPAKPAHHLAAVGQISVRQAQRNLAGDQGIGLGTMRGLLCTEHGFEFLKVFMMGCHEEWWIKFKKAGEAGKLRHELECRERRLREIEEATGS